ncbi:multi antimicrobial extrusion protein MatE [Mesobacillus maritimus]|uniref:multi antimicrobial extrusion protein MatE n=1 Tax=Mesobacillus maritimus TaxID=1643336 RepID=UPI0038505AF4
MKKATEALDYKTLLVFFIPLGFSASLVTMSHLIINSTLVRGENSEFIIASYTIALSFFGMIERLGVLLRQTCSSLVRDRYSFKLLSKFALYLLTTLMLISVAIAYTSVGDFIFATIYGVNAQMVATIKGIYQILIFVTVFSTLRCLCQGVIIYHRQTKWLTIGMGIRLAVMYGLAMVFIHTGQISGKTGAVIFLVGMAIECLISFLEARKLVSHMPEKHERQVESQRVISRFYFPLMFSSVITVMIGPAINVFLGKTSDIELAIASYAVALSVTQLFLSFFSYTHQIVINFYEDHSEKVKKFTFLVGFLPFILIALFSFTPMGRFFLEEIMGVEGRLLMASLDVLKVFLLMALVFPFVDYFNGLLMVHKQTKVTIVSQASNLIVTFICLMVGIRIAAEWNGVIGAFAQSMGLLAELVVVSSIIHALNRSRGKGSFNLKKDSVEKGYEKVNPS